MRALLGLALVLMLAALVVLLVPPRRRRNRLLPSAMLTLATYRLDGDWSYVRVLRESNRRPQLANHLMVRQNEWIWARTNEAQALFLSAALCAGAAVLRYLRFSP